MSEILGSTTLTGVTGGPDGTQDELWAIIDIDTAGVAGFQLEGTHTYVFLTFDSQGSPRVVSNHYKMIDHHSQLLGEAGTQGAAFIDAPGIEAAADGGVFRVALQPVEAVTGPVRWRAVVVVATGEEVSDSKITYGSKPIDVVTPLPEGAVETLFLAYADTAETLYGENVSFIVGVEDAGTNIDVFQWSVAGPVEAISGGPWFQAAVVSWIPPPPEPPYVRPPPTNADDFWAVPACCQCGDVFVINDDTLAETWDVEGSAALIDGKTLLLNYTDEEGTRWSMTNIEGWWTLPPPDLPDLKRAGYLDGSFPVDGRYEAREFTVDGVFIPGPNVSVAVPRQRLLRALDAVRGGALFVAKEPIWAKQAWVYLADQPQVETPSATGLTEFSFTLKAVDPIKYHAGTVGLQQVTLTHSASGYLKRTYDVDTAVDEAGVPIDPPMYSDEAVARGRRFRFPPPQKADLTQAPNPYRRYQENVVAGSTSFMNAGTAVVYPRIYIYGPCSNPVITNLTTGQQMRFIGDVRAGEVLVADCHWRVVVSRQADVLPSLSPIGDVVGTNKRWMLDFSSEWIGIEPGLNTFRLDASGWTEGASAVIVFRSGWMG